MDEKFGISRLGSDVRFPSTRFTRSTQGIQDALEKIILHQNDAALKLAVCLDRNTDALKQCSDELHRFRDRSINH